MSSQPLPPVITVLWRSELLLVYFSVSSNSNKSVLGITFMVIFSILKSSIEMACAEASLLNIFYHQMLKWKCNVEMKSTSHNHAHQLPDSNSFCQQGWQESHVHCKVHCAWCHVALCPSWFLRSDTFWTLSHTYYLISLNCCHTFLATSPTSFSNIQTKINQI